MNMALSMLQGRSELNETVADIIYRCNMCGACDVSCKVYRDDIDLTEVLLEMRADCVERGHLIADHMLTIDAMKNENNVFGEPKAERGAWAEGLGLKDASAGSCEVLLHAGCRYSYDPDLRPVMRSLAMLLTSAGVDVAVAGKEEACCGGRAYELGYRGGMANFADDMTARVKSSGASLVVTACSDCYAAFRYLYPRACKALPAPVVHAGEYLLRLLEMGKLRLRRQVPLLVTYHDPCHLGRMGEPFLGDWQGDKLLRPMSMKRAGKRGVYDTPRALLNALPGVDLVEMERIREYSWCCGAGGGVPEAYPEFASWTAAERLAEALDTGAEALATACPWCVRSFRDAAAEAGIDLPIYELTELVRMATGIGEEVSA
jgi:Fe-S oxidoreductase